MYVMAWNFCKGTLIFIYINNILSINEDNNKESMARFILETSLKNYE